MSSKEQLSLKLLFLIKMGNFYNLAILEKDPLMNLLEKFIEIECLLELNPHEVIKLLYFSKTKVHDILYEEEQIICIDKGEKFYNEKLKLSYNFYLNLLISDNATITNYN